MANLFIISKDLLYTLAIFAPKPGNQVQTVLNILQPGRVELNLLAVIAKLKCGILQLVIRGLQLVEHAFQTFFVISHRILQPGNYIADGFQPLSVIEQLVCAGYGIHHFLAVG
ncbi:hypothetical protein D3C74_418020 [compost metagenome]